MAFYKLMKITREKFKTFGNVFDNFTHQNLFKLQLLKGQQNLNRKKMIHGFLTMKLQRIFLFAPRLIKRERTRGNRLQ